MGKNTDVMVYFPKVLQDYREIKELTKAENPEFTKSWAEIERALNRNYILSADEKGLEKYEELLSIIPGNNDSLEIRRIRVLSRWFSDLPYTERKLREKLELLLGVSGYELAVYDYRLRVNIYSSFGSLVSEIRTILEEMLPMTIQMELVYENTIVCTIHVGGVFQQADELRFHQVN